MNEPLQHLVIVGRDAPLWLAACVMQSALGPSGLRVTAIELPSRIDAADGYAALPALEALHTRLRIDEGRLLAATRGAFSLGRHFHDTTGKAASFFHAFGSTGARIDTLEFLPQWIRARRHGMPVGFEDFCLTAVAARHGRMLLPDAELEKYGFTDYGYHLPAIPYGAWLRQLALRRGVMVHEAREVVPKLHADNGDITGLMLDGSREIGGEFFIDASGSEAMLSAALEKSRENWRDSFPANRLLVAHAPPMPSLPVYADVRAGESGWLALQPNQSCTHAVYAYSGETPDDLALEQARRLARMDLQGARMRMREPGRRVGWTRNCVAIGESACVFDAIHGVDLQAVQLGLVHLLPLFPNSIGGGSAEFAIERQEYNQNLRSAFDRIRDFQSAHYVLNRYGGSFWERARVTPVHADLLRKIGVFRARGEVVHYEDETFSIADWQSLLLGHGVLPDTWDPAVDRTAPEVVQGEFKRILAFIRQKVEWQRSHAEHLQLHCAPSVLPHGDRQPRDAQT